MADVLRSELRTRIKQRSNHEHSGSNFVTDTEINQLINTSYEELYGELCRSGIFYQGQRSVQTVAATGASYYDLNTDIFMIVAVYRLENGRYIPLPRHSPLVHDNAVESGPARSYSSDGGNIYFYPRAASGGSYVIKYIPLPTLPSTATAGDSYTFGLGSGWDEYIVWDVASKIMAKEENWEAMDRFEAKRDRVLERVKAEANAQELTQSYYITGGPSRYTPGDYTDRAGYNGSLANLPYWLW